MKAVKWLTKISWVLSEELVPDYVRNTIAVGFCNCHGIYPESLCQVLLIFLAKHSLDYYSIALDLCKSHINAKLLALLKSREKPLNSFTITLWFYWNFRETPLR